MHEYQKKRLTRFSFCKRLILMGMFLGEQVEPKRKKKSSGKLPHSPWSFYRVNYTMGYRTVKENLGNQIGCVIGQAETDIVPILCSRTSGYWGAVLPTENQKASMRQTSRVDQVF